LINIHHLELFYHVAKHRGISAAARKMPYGIQQPAISGQVSQLEKTLGTKLFHRRPFGLTAAGRKLFDEIELFFTSLKELPDRVRGHAKRRLRFAAPAIILRDYLPDILRGYKRRDRDFRLTLYDANQATAEALLTKGEIDLAITELEGAPGASINSCTLVRLPLILVVPKSLMVRTLGDFFRDKHPSESLISLPSDEVISKHFHAGLKKLGRAWTPTIEVTSLELVDIYTSLGFGVGVSVTIPRARRKSGLCVVPLRQFPPLTVAALWIGQLSDPAASFLADVKKLAGRLGR
jgi:DNA-binding transcriptional LysR family regulator